MVFFGLPDFKYYKYQTLANKCSLLKKQGYIKQKNGVYFITHKGERFLKKQIKESLQNFKHTKKTMTQKIYLSCTIFRKIKLLLETGFGESYKIFIL